MKRFLPFIAIATLLASCTLSMEEWTVPEEEKGFEEAETVETKYGNYTYQFKEGVRSITENVQEYIIDVEDDSILYFMDNTPDEWLPRVGDKVAAMCTPVIPFGLNHKVIDVQDIGGMYRVTCTQASRDDIYEQLIIDFDYELVSENVPMYDSLYLDSLGVNPDDLIVEDFSLLEEYYGKEAMAKAKRPRRAYRKNEAWKRTRAALNLPEDYLATREGSDETETDTPDRWPVSFSFTEQITNINLSISGEVVKHCVQRVKYRENKATDFKEQITTDKSYDIWDVTVSVSKGSDVFDSKKPSDLNPERFKRLKNYLKKLDEAKPEPKRPKKMAGGKVLTPLPFCPAFSVAVSLKGNVTFKGALCGHAKIQHNHPWVRTGYKYENGKKYSYRPDKVQDESRELLEFDAYGQLSITASLKAAIGIEITGTGLGGEVGFEVGATLSSSINLAAPDNNVHQMSEEGLCTLNAFFTITAAIYFSPAGFDIASVADTLLNKSLGILSFNPYPMLNRKKCSHSYTIGETDNYYSMKIRFKQLWELGMPSAKCYPRLRLYKEGYDATPEVFRYNPEKDEQEVKADRQYTFEYNAKTGEYNQLYFVPCIYDAVHDEWYEFRNSALIFGDASPQFKYVREKTRVCCDFLTFFKKQMPKDIDAQKAFLEMFDMGNIEPDDARLKNWYYHEAALRVEVKNLGMFYRWGVNFQAKQEGGDKKTLINENIELKDDNKKNGDRTFVFSFVSNYPKSLTLIITPFTIGSDKKTKKSYKPIGSFQMYHDTYVSNWNWDSWPGIVELQMN